MVVIAFKQLVREGGQFYDNSAHTGVYLLAGWMTMERDGVRYARIPARLIRCGYYRATGKAVLAPPPKAFDTDEGPCSGWRIRGVYAADMTLAELARVSFEDVRQLRWQLYMLKRRRDEGHAPAPEPHHDQEAGIDLSLIHI